jgi:hypothetical protein
LRFAAPVKPGDDWGYWLPVRIEQYASFRHAADRNSSDRLPAGGLTNYPDCLLP